MNRRSNNQKPTPTMDAVMKRARTCASSQRAQAAVLGLPLTTWQRLLRGERSAALGDLDQMAKALGLSIVVAPAGTSLVPVVLSEPQEH